METKKKKIFKTMKEYIEFYAVKDTDSKNQSKYYRIGFEAAQRAAHKIMQAQECF